MKIEFQEVLAYEKEREKQRTKKVTKTQLKSEYKKLLSKYARGNSPDMRYRALVRARNYANEHGLDWCAENQKRLVDSAKELLNLVLDYEQGILKAE